METELTKQGLEKLINGRESLLCKNEALGLHPSNHVIRCVWEVERGLLWLLEAILSPAPLRAAASKEKLAIIQQNIQHSPLASAHTLLTHTHA